MDRAQRSLSVPNRHDWPSSPTGSRPLGLLGRGSEAAAAPDELIECRPDFTCALARKRLFYVKDRSQLECFLQGLRKAGIPEYDEIPSRPRRLLLLARC